MSNAATEGGELQPEGKRRPGLKPGQTTSSSFKPGAEWRGNRFGVYGKAGKDAAHAVVGRARKFTVTHVDTLNAIVTDDSEPAAARVAAFRELKAISGLDKAIARLEEEQEGLDIAALSDDDLLRMIGSQALEGEVEDDASHESGDNTLILKEEKNDN